MKKKFIFIIFIFCTLSFTNLFGEYYLETWFKIKYNCLGRKKWTMKTINVRANTAIRAIKKVFKKEKKRRYKIVRILTLKRYSKQIGRVRNIEPEEEK